jgi:hypothetical protein
MEPEPTIYLGERELSFSLGFPYAHFLSEITNEVYDALPQPPEAGQYDVINARIAEIYQRRLAAEMEEATGFHTEPAPVSGLVTAGPALTNIDYLALAGLLLGANLAVSVINNWADMAERVIKAIRWLKSKAEGEPPVISDGMALILGSKALIDATGRNDLGPSFVAVLGQYPPRREDEPPEIDFDYLVGARTKRWMYLCRVSDRGEASYLGRVRVTDSEATA